MADLVKAALDIAHHLNASFYHVKCDANSKADLLVKGGGGKQSLVIAADEDISLVL